MSSSSSAAGGGITRRGFLCGTAAGLAGGAALGWLGHSGLARFQGKSREVARPEAAMPGPYPGRVIRVHHPAAVRANHKPNEEIVRRMVHTGLTRLVDGDPKDPVSSWKKFFTRGDVVGIKVNPVGRAPLPGEPRRVRGAVGCVSSPEIVFAIVDGLLSAGVKREDIIIFERYANEFMETYSAMMASDHLRGIRWLASSSSYSDNQVDIEGFDGGREQHSLELNRHVVGYDPDVYQHMGFCAPSHDDRDDRRLRSHLSLIISRMVNKFITIPCLKDHRSAGVTIALKNMSHGLNNNVARSHNPRLEHVLDEGIRVGPNQCNTFIPQAVAQQPIKDKATLHILDGLIGVYEGGPGNWNQTWGTWHYNSLLFATDPVAMDHVGWAILDQKRAAVRLEPVARMGLTHVTNEVHAGSGLALLAAGSPVEAAALNFSAGTLTAGRASEGFDLRTPQHVNLASGLGLGVFDARRIDYRVSGI